MIRTPLQILLSPEQEDRGITARASDFSFSTLRVKLPAVGFEPTHL
jgi:hypothetical protein